MKRRTFLIGAAAALGGVVVGYRLYSSSFEAHAKKLVTGKGEALLAGWIKIAEDDTITAYMPHLEMGQGSHTGLAMLVAEELDADWTKIKADYAPADPAFANRFLAEGWITQNLEIPNFLNGTVDEVFALASRQAKLQMTGGSLAIRTTGRYGMRVVAASARQ
ncbi:MAG: molybdopterin cofactor-binding domain-containing protein, partial [Methyloligellaceae bacterium]